MAFEDGWPADGMSLLREQLRRIASHPTSVFIAGQPGTGKVLARYLHEQSPRAAAPFVTVAVAGLATENPGAEPSGARTAARSTSALEKANGRFRPAARSACAPTGGQGDDGVRETPAAGGGEERADSAFRTCPGTSLTRMLSLLK